MYEILLIKETHIHKLISQNNFHQSMPITFTYKTTFKAVGAA